ncbi:FAD-dependent oxidoreductase [Luedemannella flava]|uniref:FAD-dependent oxidoreductase n=2 Tax=Luedemannella flava TaxID=349316 RepID=A0ABP4YER2_9ACTN
MTGMAEFVVVGASLAGAKAVETLRAEGFAGRITLIGAETERPYERPPLSKGYLQGSQERDKAFVHEPGWYREHDVDLILGLPVTALDPHAHTVTVDRVDRIGYDKLLLATGSRPRVLDLPGSDNLGLRYLRTLADADALRAAFRPGANVVVVGGGWIGLETAAAAIGHGCTVTLIEREAAPPLARVLGAEVGEIFQALHESHGVRVLRDSTVREFGGLSGRLTHLVLDDNLEIPADVAVIGVGIAPNVELASAAGLLVDDGIVTDASMRTSDPDIYAAGDVASSLNPLLGKRIRVEHWANARNGGPAAARAMLGRDVVYDRLPYFFSDQYDLGMEYAGYVEPDGYDRVVFRGDVAGREFLAFWTRERRVLAGMNVNVWDVQDDIQRLVRAGYAGRSVDLDRLADPAVALADLTG